MSSEATKPTDPAREGRAPGDQAPHRPAPDAPTPDAPTPETLALGHIALGHLALGHDALDRRADLRTAGWGAVPGDRRVILLDPDGEAAVHPGAEGAVTLADAATAPVPHNGPPTPAPAPTPTPTPAPTPAPAPAADARDIFLGVDSRGRAVCGRVVQRDAAEVPAGVEWAGLRSIGMRLSGDERGILAEFLALANWHRTHARCPRCGASTVVSGLGWWRTCPEDGTEHYPRTDPAVIAILVDSQGNALLGRQARWPQGAFSTLAGFVEPGESAESAVVREIAEEVALRPTGARYVGSQPWPFPASLMLGFEASIEGVRPEPTVDGTEIVEALWLSREELAAACRERIVRLPGRLSIAHHLVRRWYGADLPDEWCRW